MDQAEAESSFGKIILQSVRVNLFRFGISKDLIKIEVESGLPLVYCDARRVKQILVNLISNAIKYSQDGSAVTVRAFCVDGRVVMQIIDQGFGMNGRQVKVAFSEYGRVDNPNSGKVDSIGLGLPIVKSLVDKHGWSIEVNSKIGAGSCFTIKT